MVFPHAPFDCGNPTSQGSPTPPSARAFLSRDQNSCSIIASSNLTRSCFDIVPVTRNWTDIAAPVVTRTCKESILCSDIVQQSHSCLDQRVTHPRALPMGLINFCYTSTSVITSTKIQSSREKVNSTSSFRFPFSRGTVVQGPSSEAPFPAPGSCYSESHRFFPGSFSLTSAGRPLTLLDIFSFSSSALY